MKEHGYKGTVTLISSTGEERVIKVPGRWRQKAGAQDYGSKEHWPNNRLKTARTQITTCGRATEAVKNLQDKNLRRLLSAGWKVKTSGHSPASSVQVGEEEKKDTDKVSGATTGDQSHGGDHASKEVKDSTNASEQGEKKESGAKGYGGKLQSPGASDSDSAPAKERGCRGGTKKRKEKRNKNRFTNRKPVQVQKCNQSGGGAVYAPQPLVCSREDLKSAEKSAALLAELIGRSSLKTTSGISVSTERLLVSLETGENPVPFLEFPAERPKLRVLITPDCSGSCQGWSSVSVAWALHIAKIPGIDVLYVENANGYFWGVEGEDVQKLLNKVDVLIYLGDGDGKEICKQYATSGATVLALDSYCANVANPRLNRERLGKGELFWVDRVSAKISATWYEALKLCLRK